MVYVAATSFVVALLLCANATVNVTLNIVAAWMQQCLPTRFSQLSVRAWQA